MVLFNRMWQWIFSNLVCGCALWGCSAGAPVAQAGFELQLDADSLRQVNGHYAMDVNLVDNTLDNVLLRGIFAAITSTEPGLTFLGIEAPEADAPAFGTNVSYTSDSDQEPVYGEEGLLWGAYVTINAGKPPVLPHSGVAFQLHFSVEGSNEYGLELVGLDGLDQVSGYTVDLGTDAPEARSFDSLNSVHFRVVSTPEPSSVALFLTAVGGLSVWRCRRRLQLPT